MVDLYAELLALRQQLLAFERQQAPLLEAVAESCRPVEGVQLSGDLLAISEP